MEIEIALSSFVILPPRLIKGRIDGLSQSRKSGSWKYNTVDDLFVSWLIQLSKCLRLNKKLRSWVKTSYTSRN